MSEIFEKNVDFFFEFFEKIGTDLGWFGGDFGTVWGYFRTDFENFEKLEVQN